jgi:hypothetical protein
MKKLLLLITITLSLFLFAKELKASSNIDYNITKNSAYHTLISSDNKAANRSKIEHYFRYYGIKTLALLAHPTLTFSHGEFWVGSDKVLIDIYYTDRVVELSIKRNGNLFTNIDVISDPSFIPPFLGIELIKGLVLDMIETPQDQANLSYFERVVGRTIQEMSGRHMACFVITIGLLNDD